MKTYCFPFTGTGHQILRFNLHDNIPNSQSLRGCGFGRWWRHESISLGLNGFQKTTFSEQKKVNICRNLFGQEVFEESHQFFCFQSSLWDIVGFVGALIPKTSHGFFSRRRKQTGPMKTCIGFSPLKDGPPPVISSVITYNSTYRVISPIVDPFIRPLTGAPQLHSN